MEKRRIEEESEKVETENPKLQHITQKPYFKDQECNKVDIKVVGIVGSYRKGKTIDSAVSAVLEGAQAKGAETKKIYLIDEHIEFCTN